MEEVDSSDEDSSDYSEEETDGSAIEGQGDKSGNLNVRVGTVNKRGQVKPGSKWVYAYFLVSGGSLHFYIRKEDNDPKASIILKNATLNKTVECRPFKHCFSITTATLEILVSAQGAEEWSSWTSALEAAASKLPTVPPTRGDKVAKLNLKERAKRSVIAKTTTSKMGKRAIKSKAPPQMTELINALKTLVQRETGSSRKANDMENNVLRVGVKMYFLVVDGKLEPRQVLLADQPLRQALKVFGGCRDHVSAVRFSGRITLKKDLLETRLEEVAMLVRQAGEHLTESLQPYVRPANIQRINDTVAYFGNPEVLMRVLLDETYEPDLDVLMLAAKHYAQFHFYEEDIAPMARRLTMAL